MSYTGWFKQKHWNSQKTKRKKNSEIKKQEAHKGQTGDQLLMIDESWTTTPLYTVCRWSLLVEKFAQQQVSLCEKGVVCGT